MISNSGHDERGLYSGGVAGDQTGGEWRIQEWYSRPWTHVLRYPVREVADMIGQLAEEAAKNDLIGYDQNQRTTFWKQLEKVGYRPSLITTACEADCSAGVAAIIKAVGYLMNIEELKNVSKDMYTGNEIAVLTAAGFSTFTDSAFLASDKWLYRGDVLLCKGHHTCINLTDGARVASTSWRWVQSGGKWYYQNALGANLHGWSLIKESAGKYSHWYYFDSTGAAVTGWRYIDDKLYLFCPEGPLQCAMCVTDESGAQTPQSILE